MSKSLNRVLHTAFVRTSSWSTSSDYIRISLKNLIVFCFFSKIKKTIGVRTSKYAFQAIFIFKKSIRVKSSISSTSVIGTYSTCTLAICFITFQDAKTLLLMWIILRPVVATTAAIAMVQHWTKVKYGFDASKLHLERHSEFCPFQSVHSLQASSDWMRAYKMDVTKTSKVGLLVSVQVSGPATGTVSRLETDTKWTQLRTLPLGHILKCTEILHIYNHIEAMFENQLNANIRMWLTAAWYFPAVSVLLRSLGVLTTPGMWSLASFEEMPVLRATLNLSSFSWRVEIQSSRYNFNRNCLA